jgi:hypothetical protein
MASSLSLRTTLSASHTAVERVDLSSIDSPGSAKTFVTAVFEEPITIDGPQKGPIPKATLVVGAGKLERAKYDEELGKWVTMALREIGYLEDRGASALEACQGTFKYQHDTGKNEKYVHVFPRVTRAAASAAEEGLAEDEEEQDTPGADAAEKLCLQSSEETFKQICEQRVTPWLCRKRLLKFLQDSVDKLKETEAKMARMVRLEPSEQKLFDMVDRELVERKIAWLRAEMISMVDDGHLTKQERLLALEQAKTRLREMEAEGRNVDTVRARIAGLEKSMSEPGYRHPLKHEQKLRVLMGQSMALDPLQDKAGTKGRWSSKLTSQEVQLLGKKEDLDAEIANLASASRFWFEEEDELAERLKGCRALVKVNTRSGGAAKAAPRQQQQGWSTVVTNKAKPVNFSALQVSKKPSSNNAFGGLADSDDDD